MKIPTYYNGVITPFASASIPLSDRSIFFSDAVYEVMIGRNGSVHQFNEHFARLHANCKAIGLEPCICNNKLSEIIHDLLSLSSPAEFMVYVQISGQSEKRAHLRPAAEPNVLVYIDTINVPSKPQEIKAITLPDMRYEYCNLKTTNLLPAVLSMKEAAAKNADVAIFHKNSLVTECTHANVAIITNGEVKTPPLSHSILPGITRRSMLNACTEKSIPYREDPISISDLLSSDAVIICSTTKLLQICTEINGVAISTSAQDTVESIFKALHTDFMHIIEN